MKKILGALAFSLALLASSGVSAQIYIAFAGVEGENPIRGMDNATRIDGVSFGASNSSTTLMTSGAMIGKTSFSALSFSKTRGAASAALGSALFSGKHFAKVELRFNKPGTNNAYLLITLEEVFITGWEMSADSGAIATENMKLTFGRFRMEDVITAADGTTKRVPSGWDLTRSAAY